MQSWGTAHKIYTDKRIFTFLKIISVTLNTTNIVQLNYQDFVSQWPKNAAHWHLEVSCWSRSFLFNNSIDTNSSTYHMVYI